MNRQTVMDFSSYYIKDLVCFCHLRWDFVYQRPQHLMTRFGKRFRVFFIEEPLYHEGKDDYFAHLSRENVWIITPLLQEKYFGKSTLLARQKKLVDRVFEDNKIHKYIAWYYTPMALKFTFHLKPELTIYDCMDELSAFKFAPVELKILEAELFKKAELVFTGGYNLYNAKKNAHTNIYPFPSSIDKEHFSRARTFGHDPVDQAQISHLRFGFYGVIDERFNKILIKDVAERRPDWQFILVGPVVKIDPCELPRRNNIHYLGGKSYELLPDYLSGWDFTMIPFEINESTKYISPTKTPEYLAAGKPVISTSIVDVIRPYADEKLVYIADDATQFIAAAESELAKSDREKRKWLQSVDIFLANTSWDLTSHKMLERINDCLLPGNSVTKTGLKSVA